MKNNQLSEIIEQIISGYKTDRGINHIEGPNLPSKKSIEEITLDILNIIFPGYYEKQEISREDINLYVWEKVASVYHSLSHEISKSLKAVPELAEKSADEIISLSINKTVSFLSKIQHIREKLNGDVDAAFEGDPAAKSFDEIIVSYPGLFAIAVYRAAHELFHLEIPLIPRIMTEFAHGSTGIDIHPGAHIGDNFFIDHGTGIVIGETTLIGNNVRIYQGVSLGALSFKKDKDGHVVKGGKRHPTIEDNVVIYAGATILGGQTVVGRDSVIGGNVWLLKSVPPGTTLIHQPPKLVLQDKNIDTLQDKYMYYI
jgi:serine O-acetyltransferase